MTRPRPTTIVDAPRLSKKVGVDLVLASETLQYTGSFKFRAAYNVASNVKQSHIITASSGNFGQAIAYACALFKKRCTVVMPATAPKIKVDAVREYGAEVDLVDLKKKGRLERLGRRARQTIPRSVRRQPLRRSIGDRRECGTRERVVRSRIGSGLHYRADRWWWPHIGIGEGC